MSTETVEKISFFSSVELPERWARILPFIIRKLWERICREFGDVPPNSNGIVLLQDEGNTELVRFGKEPPAILVTCPDLIGLMGSEIEGGSFDEKLLRSFRVVMAEELVHLHDLFVGKLQEIHHF
jgi:hypothetical protein